MTEATVSEDDNSLIEIIQSKERIKELKKKKKRTEPQEFVVLNKSVTLVSLKS